MRIAAAIIILLLGAGGIHSQAPFYSAGSTYFVPLHKRPSAGGGGSGASFSDDFNRANSDSLGANWTEADTDVDIASNAASVPAQFDFSQNVAIYTGTATATANQYVKVSMTFASTGRPSIYLRYTGSSSAFYEISFDHANSTVRWYHWTAIGGTQTQVGSDMGSFAVTSPQSIGVTITGTGNSTVIRLFKAPSGNAPDSGGATWGSASPDNSFTDDPSSAVNTGTGVGLGGFNNGGTVGFDDFFGGDVP